MFLENLLDLTSNKTCVICKKEIPSQKEICDECLNKISNILYNYSPCPKCSLNLKKLKTACFCKTQNFIFENNYSCLPFDEFYHKAFIEAKYHSKLKIADFFINFTIKNFNKTKLNFYTNNIDLIVPVPISYTKKLKRGYSISTKFAKKINFLINKKIINLFYEKGKIYTHLERNKKNFDFSKKFHITKNKNKLKKIKNKNILLIDDIFTTGATINFLATQLKKMGCNKVYSLTLLRTQFKM